MSFRRPPPKLRIDYGPFQGASKRVVAKNLTREQKEWLGEQISSKIQDVKDIANWSTLSVKYLYKLGSRARKGGPTFGSVGRPVAFDLIAETTLREYLVLDPKTKQAKFKPEFKKKTTEVRKETDERRGGNGLMMDGPSTSTLRKLIQKLKIKSTNKAGTTTEPRRREESDPRNMVAEAALLQAYSADLEPDCIINMDATQYCCGKDGIVQEVMWIKGNEENPSVPVSRQVNELDDMGLYIKVYNQVASNGTAAPMVSVIACQDMEDEEFAYFKMAGLSATTDASCYMWVCMVKSRGGNDAFYQWFIANSVLPFIDLCRENCGVENSKVLYSTDGEEIQLRNFLDQREQFSARLVSLMKHSASCSALTNALDCGNPHKATKKVVKHASEDDVHQFKAVSQNKLDGLLAIHAKKISKARRDIICDRILRVVYAYQKVLTRLMILHAFQKSGQLIPKSSTSKDFLDSKLALCKSRLTREQVAACRAVFAELVQIAKTNGKISEAEFDSLGIPKLLFPGDKRKKVKDKRPLHNQRSAIVNHEYICKEYADYQATPTVVARKATTAAKKNAAAMIVPRVIDVPVGTGIVAAVIPTLGNNTNIANTAVADPPTPVPAPIKSTHRQVSVPYQDYTPATFASTTKRKQIQAPEEIVYGPPKTKRVRPTLIEG